MGYVYETPDVGYYAEAPELGYYGETPEVGYYGESPETMGYYGESADVMGYDEAPQDVGYFAEAPFEGYVRERDMSARVVPVENIGGVEGFYRPRTVNPSCESFRPPEEETKPSTSWFQPIW